MSNIKVLMIVEMEIDPQGLSEADILQKCRRVVKHGMEEGLFTVDTPATVEDWGCEVQRVPLQIGPRKLNPWENNNINDDEYVDFSQELVGFYDKGNSSVDMTLSFNTELRSVYLVLQSHNDSGRVGELLGDKSQIDITWEEGLRLLGDTPIPDKMKEAAEK